MTWSPQALEFLDRHLVARLATASAEGEPHVVPFCYALLDHCIYFVIDEKPKRTHQGLKRLQNIRGNSRVALVVDDYDDDWHQLAYLLVRGRAAIVDDAGEFARALAQLRIRYRQYVDMPLSHETHPMVRITPERIRFWRAASSIT